MVRSASPLLLAVAAGCAATTFELASARNTAALWVAPGEPESVRLAAADLARDVATITGRQPKIVQRMQDCRPACVVVASLAHSRQLLWQLQPQLAGELEGKPEAYRVRLLAKKPNGKRALLIAGSDPLGTIFAIYAFSREYLGVEPLHFWTGLDPPRRRTLRWSDVRIGADGPTFRYRGWFINDEDLLTGWRDGGGHRFIDYPFYHQVIHPEVMERILEAALRLRFNLIIPSSFVDITNPPEQRLVAQATRRGLYVSMHHVEPLGVSGFAFQSYWQRKGQNVPFIFHSQRWAFEHAWRYFAIRWSRYPGVIWQLGLRGIADRPFWHHDPTAPANDQERGAIISDAMARQWEIVRAVDARPEPPATTTLWAEGAGLMRRGFLKVPRGVTVVFSDNSPGWVMQEDFYESPRDPARTYGIYYHHALWGSGPHLVQAVPPWKTYEILRQAAARRSAHYAMFNVGNVREFVLGLEATGAMSYELASFDPEKWFRDWCQNKFAGAEAGAEQAYRQFFDAYVIDGRLGIPSLLDGQTLHAGRRLLAEITDRAVLGSQLAAPRPGGKRLKVPGMSASEVAVLARKLRAQRERLERALNLAAPVASRLRSQHREFFESNLLAQAQILAGLCRWAEQIALARSSLDSDRQAALDHLGQAVSSFEMVREGRSLASRGRWRDWYRGDRKMNLDRAEWETRQAIELLQQNQSGP